MLINDQAVEAAFNGFKTVYTDAYNKVTPDKDRVAMTVPSSSRAEDYGWLGQFPQLREWLDGERVLKNLEAHSFTITNRKFESTVNVKREDFEDDRLGLFKPMVAEAGHLARQHPDELIFDLLNAGNTELCYDGQNFFDTDHPSTDAAGDVAMVSNIQEGDQNNQTGPAWYLLDTTRAVKPLIWQERVPYDFQMMTNPKDQRVFMTDQFTFGVRARVNAGYGLWQLAYRSNAPLKQDTYGELRTMMQRVRGDKGRLLGVKPDVIVVPPELEYTARFLLDSPTVAHGNANPWYKSAQVLVTPYLGGE